MPKFAANLSMMYQEHAFLDRFAAAARDGFSAVEFLFPYAFPAAEIKSRLEAEGLTQVLFNAPPGDWDHGERGMAALPGREEEFRSGIAQALDYAGELGTTRLHVMAGILHDKDRAAARASYVQNLRWAAGEAAKKGVTILIEPINTRDMPDYFLNYQADAHALREEVGAANLKVQLDLYHCQIMEGDLATTIRRDLAHIGHMQVAGVPGRHEPDTQGEINFPYLFALLDELGYDGWIGCEYRPRAGTSEGLDWLREWKTKVP